MVLSSQYQADGSNTTPSPSERTTVSASTDGQSAPATEGVQARAPVPRPRAPMRKRSKVWAHFDEVLDENKKRVAAVCIKCKTRYVSDSKTNGTSSLLAHIPTCKGDGTETHEPGQALLNFQPKNESDSGVGTLTTWKYDYGAIRESIAYMVIVDELPFKFVEGRGFKRVMSKACPRFTIPSRWSITRDCYGLFVSERSKLKSFLNKNCQRVSLTTDTWTSLQKINYMCVTVHFIDNAWNLNKRILSFVPVTSHKGDYIGKAIEKCILEWGLNNIFTITVDNASSNDTAMSFLKNRMKNREECIAHCKYLQMRCIAHVINLIVGEGLKKLNPSVKRIRHAVRYIKNSPTRLSKFKACVDLEGIESKSLLCLDVKTRWNSIYMMLSTAVKFERAFGRYKDEENSFASDLGIDNVPTPYDWICAKRLSDLLKYFYDVTMRISGSLYITSNTFFSEISDLCCVLNEWKKSDDPLVKDLGDSMKTKFDKYWGESERMNKIIFWANVFYPRDKYEYMAYSLTEMHGAEKGNRILEEVKCELVELFEEYKRKYQPENDSSVSNSGSCLSNNSDSESVSSKSSSFLKAKYKKQKLQSGGNATKKSELEMYLIEDVVDESENLDVLKWWKLNSERFPVLSRMARDMLGVPISTVASESTFSTGGRILDRFRSSLTPKIVEALICAQDWLRNEEFDAYVEEQLEELEEFEKDLPTVGIAHV